MSLLIKNNGDLVCAAINKQETNDLYFDDNIHHFLCSKKLIVTQKEPEHTKNGGIWWWKGQEPKGVEIDPWWYES